MTSSTATRKWSIASLPMSAGAVATHELEAARSKSLPTLESYTLLMGAITPMHRNSLREFEEARAMLEEVAGPRDPPVAPARMDGQMVCPAGAAGLDTGS